MLAKFFVPAKIIRRRKVGIFWFLHFLEAEMILLLPSSNLRTHTQEYISPGLINYKILTWQKRNS